MPSLSHQIIDERDYVENCSAEYDKDCSDSKRRYEIRETDDNFSS
ncbi:hypothetical protein WUBG_02697 [Wuchereria bancrofti]|uniref:Uncharacterized protein n=1 Tax=Wuchereria bancrofti TaxID=6293 RepID=J9F9Z7_WUCBA|nr:hypothetical protein WUBG_02697 [Wuchereria bancrofti]